MMRVKKVMNSRASIIPPIAAIETSPPVVFASRLALREGNCKKPIYQIHKWWARRLGSVFRSLLLAATTPEEKSAVLSNGFFYKRHDLSGLVVLDPFVGGGTSLVEAAKCGATVVGVDVDPVACFVTAKELQACNEKALLAAFSALESEVKEELVRWYRTTLPDGRQASVVYAFWVDQIQCPNCKGVFDGHPHFQLRRFPKKKKQIIFCSHCGETAAAALSETKHNCPGCHNRTNLHRGPVRNALFSCPDCRVKTPRRALTSDSRPLPQKLFALEVLVDETKERVFKKVDQADLALYQEAERFWAIRREQKNLVPDEFISVRDRDDPRPISLGYRRYRDLFCPRQLLCLSRLAESISHVEDRKAREFLALAFSDSLAANNMFCFYAFDYGKLTPLFGLHAYAKVSRPVENNVWGTEVGRGSFLKCFYKLLEAKRYAAKPFEYAYGKTGKVTRKLTGESIRSQVCRRKLSTKVKGKPGALLLNQSSESLHSISARSIDLILSDPPYYDNLAYSELSEFYHVWLKRLRLPSYPGNGCKRTPLKESLYVSHRKGQSKDGTRFTEGLSRTFAECYRVLKDTGMLVFTFHHNDPKAWIALAKALLLSGFHVTNVFPVRSEGQSHFHSDERNIKWDEVIVCRKRRPSHAVLRSRDTETLHEAVEKETDRQVKRWTTLLRKRNFEFSSSDARSLKSGVMLMLLDRAGTAPAELQEFFLKSYMKPKSQQFANHEKKK
jgi:putative DNA methylase